jgi:hypothetical protein
MTKIYLGFLTQRNHRPACPLLLLSVPRGRRRSQKRIQLIHRVPQMGPLHIVGLGVVQQLFPRQRGARLYMRALRTQPCHHEYWGFSSPNFKQLGVPKDKSIDPASLRCIGCLR